ncbi:MAG: hypothetical protein HS111_12330 [Kofleriaceae bacterium]|nr:hypothetical protein [Kofleriaceae bacterium]
MLALATIARAVAGPRRRGGARRRAALPGRASDASDPQIRKRNFAAAAAAFARAARATRSAPLYTDWGNAALGAGDPGGAALAYRRALVLDGGEARARKNLTWLRTRMPEGMRPRGGGATETLFFFHGTWSRDRRLVVGAAGFALMILLCVPWGGRRRPWLLAVAAGPGVLWLVMTGSLLVEDRHERDAVVMQPVVLRTADSAGAPARLSAPVPAGVEVAIVERRDGWSRLRLPSGTTGWVPETAIERVTSF